MAEQEPPVQAPNDIAGVGIHLSYIRRDMAKMNDKLDAISTNYVPVEEHIHFKDFVEKNYVTKEELKPSVDKIEDLRDTNKWIVRTIGVIIIGAVLTLVITQIK